MGFVFAVSNMDVAHHGVKMSGMQLLKTLLCQLVANELESVYMRLFIFSVC